MTHLLALTVGVFVAVPVTWRVTWRYGVTRGDIAGYDHKRDWRALASQADHDHRNAIRWQRAVNALRRIHDDVVGDLLDKVAADRAELARLRPTLPAPVPRPPMPLYPRRRSTP